MVRLTRVLFQASSVQVKEMWITEIKKLLTPMSIGIVNSLAVNQCAFLWYSCCVNSLDLFKHTISTAYFNFVVLRSKSWHYQAISMVFFQIL